MTTNFIHEEIVLHSFYSQELFLNSFIRYTHFYLLNFFNLDPLPLPLRVGFALRRQFSLVIFHDWLWITEVSRLVSVTAVAEKYRCASAPYLIT